MKRAAMESAWTSVLFDPSEEMVVCIHRPTGEVFADSELTGEHEIPDAAEGDPDYVFLPDRFDLDLGQRVVRDFVAEFAPELADDVRRVFSRRGAYARYKDLLEEKGRLQDWYDCESRRETEAMREWCEANGIELED